MGIQYFVCALVIGLLVAVLAIAPGCKSERNTPTLDGEADSAFVVSGYNNDYDELRSLLLGFAQHHNMKFFDETLFHPKLGTLVNMQVGNPDSVLIWAANGNIDPRLIVLVFSDPSNPTSWRSYEADLKRRLEKKFGELEDITAKKSRESESIE